MIVLSQVSIMYRYASWLVLVAVAWLLLCITRYATASRRPRNFPPGPPTVPILGNLQSNALNKTIYQVSLGVHSDPCNQGWMLADLPQIPRMGHPIRTCCRAQVRTAERRGIEHPGGRQAVSPMISRQLTAPIRLTSSGYSTSAEPCTQADPTAILATSYSVPMMPISSWCPMGQDGELSEKPSKGS